MRLTKEAYGWDPDQHFHVPERGAGALPRLRGARAASSEGEWDERMAGLREAHPDLAAEFERISEGRLPEGWQSDAPKFGVDDGMIATRKSSGQVIQWAAKQVPELVGGSADLAGSTLTLIDGADSVGPGEYAGRNLHFGIREHAMGAIVNGLNLHGFRAYGATFLIFSDYMKASMRLAALMRIPSIFVFTHDSIGVGEDGPTHQPIEQLAGLRAIPNLDVVRPAGANEVALAWRFALSRPRRRLRWPSAARACPPGTRPACPTTPSTGVPTCCASPTRTPSPTWC